MLHGQKSRAGTAQPCSVLPATALLCSASLACARLAWRCTPPPRSLCSHGSGAGMPWQVASSLEIGPPSLLGCGRGRPAHTRSRRPGLAALPCRSGRRAVATPQTRCPRCSRIALAAALAGFSGSTEPHACFSSLSRAGYGSAMLINERNAHGNACTHACGVRSDDLALRPARSREIARDHGRCMYQCITRLSV